jgi:hypothetical protein
MQFFFSGHQPQQEVPLSDGQQHNVDNKNKKPEKKSKNSFLFIAKKSLLFV